MLNGREIFLQEGFEASDDASAADDYATGDDEESQIQAMLQEACEIAARTRGRWVDGCMVGWMGGWLNGWMDWRH